MTEQPKVEPTLLPCPFCGGEADVYQDKTGHEEEGETWVVACGINGCTGSSGPGECKEEAAMMWNCRDVKALVAQVLNTCTSSRLLVEARDKHSQAVSKSEAWRDSTRRCVETLREILSYTRGKAGLSDSDREDVERYARSRIRMEEEEHGPIPPRPVGPDGEPLAFPSRLYEPDIASGGGEGETVFVEPLPKRAGKIRVKLREREVAPAPERTVTCVKCGKAIPYDGVHGQCECGVQVGREIRDTITFDPAPAPAEPGSHRIEQKPGACGKSIGYKAVMEPGDFPEEAFKEYYSRLDLSSPWPADEGAARWAWARRSQEVAEAVGNARYYAKQMCAAEAARDEALKDLAAAKEQNVQDCGALDARLRMAEKNEGHAEGLLEQAEAARDAALEERDEARAKVGERINRVIELKADLASMTEERDAAVRKYSVIFAKAERLEACGSSNSSETARLIHRQRLEVEVAFQVQHQADLAAALQRVKELEAALANEIVVRETYRRGNMALQAETKKLREALEQIDCLLTRPGLRAVQDRTNAARCARAALKETTKDPELHRDAPED